MNLILTLDCNNHCAYCFQSQYKTVKEEMSLEMLEKILKWANCKENQPIRILGGEPTIYSLFSEAIDLINNYYLFNYKLLISNLLGTEQNMNKVFKEVENKNLSLLINSTTDKDKEDLMISRLKTLVEIDPSAVCLSITLTPYEKINKQYIKHFYHLINMFPNIKKIRIGACIPGTNQKYERFNYDQLFINFLDNMPRDIDDITLDCGLNKCILSDEFFKYYIFFREDIAYGCGGPPMDLLPNGTAKYCFASPDEYIIDNIFDYPNYNMLIRDMYSKELSYKIKDEKCQHCLHFINGDCFPCHSMDIAWNKRD